MSIWSTFKVMKVHDYDLHEQTTTGECECPAEGNEVYLSQAWRGWPLRLSLDTLGDGDAHVLVTRDQVRELGEALIAWADEDERRS